MTATLSAPSPPQLSRIRTFLFGAFVFVWFSEMVLWGFFAEEWTSGQNMIPPENLQLATALYLTHAVEAAGKGALGVLAVFGLRSRNAFARTALFASMALVPPLNLAIPFREEGFPLTTTPVAIVFSTILWGSLLLFREPAQRPALAVAAGSGQSPPSRWEVFQYTWFAVYSAALTLMAGLLLIEPRDALNFIFPCLSSLLAANDGGLSSLVYSSLFNGTHLLALATASWIATVYSRSNPTLRQALTVAGTVHAGLLCLLPLRRMILEVGGSCATSSVLVLSVPLLVGWMLYAIVAARRGQLRFAEERT